MIKTIGVASVHPVHAKETQVKAIDHTRKQIYHSPQKPGYTCWVAATVMPDGNMLVGFTQATGPIEGRPRAPKEICGLFTGSAF
jgi:hypothetical protein